MTTQNVFLVFSADENLMNDSKRLEQIFSTKDKAIEFLTPVMDRAATAQWEDNSYSDKETMLEDLLRNLNDIDQTQNLEVNYMIEKWTVDTN